MSTSAEDPGLKARSYLLERGCQAAAAHCDAVASEARRIAQSHQLGAEADKAYAAGWLHDISAVIPDAHRLATARQWGVDVLPEEEEFPLLLHQKLSAVIAEKEFGIGDRDVLDAVGHHTTLRRCPGTVEKVVFLADKLAWDQPGETPHGEAVRRALQESLDEGVATYLDWVWQHREQMRVIHPWLREACGQFLRV